MNFSKWLVNENKFINSSCCICKECGTNLLAVDVQENPNHFYPVGQLFKCRCSSRLWTNSIRNLDKFIGFLNKTNKEYINGFCNDLFCGYCWGYVIPLKNGVSFTNFSSKRYDLYGCPKCLNNQNILMDGNLKNRENETNWIIGWYIRHIEELKKYG